MNTAQLQKPRLTQPGDAPWDRINDRGDFAAWTLYQQRKLSLVSGILGLADKIETAQAQACRDLIDEIRRDLGPVIEYCQQSDDFLKDMGV
jgi:hypothetical protein